MRDEHEGSRRHRRPRRGLNSGMLSATTASGRVYAGPTRFKGRCEHCAETRNRHCGTCLACRGWHREGCNTVIGMAQSSVLR